MFPFACLFRFRFFFRFGFIMYLVVALLKVALVNFTLNEYMIMMCYCRIYVARRKRANDSHAAQSTLFNSFQSWVTDWFFWTVHGCLWGWKRTNMEVVRFCRLVCKSAERRVLYNCLAIICKTRISDDAKKKARCSLLLFPNTSSPFITTFTFSDIFIFGIILLFLQIQTLRELSPN